MKFTFPTYIQHDPMDCGPACLKIISKYYNKSFSLKYLRDRCYITREGVSLFDIGRAAEDIDFRTLAIKIHFEELFKVAKYVTNKHPFVLFPAI